MAGISTIRHQLEFFKEFAQVSFANFSAQKTNRKIIVFESDDWGGIRMPNPQTLQKLLATGLKVDDVSFNRLDGLENREDLDLLFNVLDKHQDLNGNPARFTCNMILGNPDFETIEKNGFSEFARESMFDSYRRYHGEDLEPIWKKAIERDLVKPQFHCREHLNSQLWMRDLRAGQPETMLCFKHRFLGLRTKTSSPVQKHYLAAYSAETLDELATIQAITLDGLNLFKSMFGFRSKTFVACNYVWPAELEQSLADEGIEGIQTRIKHTMPIISKNGQRVHVRKCTGEKNKWGQTYGVRNVLFEPYHNPLEDPVERALNEISQAFWFRTPAIISSHRINYSSAMDIRLRDNSLQGLGRLITQTLSRWPDVEFLTSDELHKMLSTR